MKVGIGRRGKGRGLKGRMGCDWVEREGAGLKGTDGGCDWGEGAGAGLKGTDGL